MIGDIPIGIDWSTFTPVSIGGTLMVMGLCFIFVGLSMIITPVYPILSDPKELKIKQTKAGVNVCLCGGMITIMGGISLFAVNVI